MTKRCDFHITEVFVFDGVEWEKMKLLVTCRVQFRPCSSDTWPLVLWMSERKL